MKTEIEAKFLDVNFEKVRARLKQIGAVCEQPIRTMRRKHFDFADFVLAKKHGFARLRDEGDKVTMSYKQVDNLGAHGTKEVSVVVDDFEQAEQLFLSLGLKLKSFHETRRESWKFDGAEIELDEWPALDPLVEIEAQSEEQLWDLAGKLGLERANSMHATIDYLYAKVYDVTKSDVNMWPEITFAGTPGRLKSRRREA